MNKKTMKVISFITIVLCIIMSLSTCFAADIDIKNQLDAKANVNVNQVASVGNQIATIIRNVGIVLAVIILMILGIKYMMGSAEEKAEYKKTMIPYLVGAVVLFGASAIAAAVVQFSNSVAG